MDVYGGYIMIYLQLFNSGPLCMAQTLRQDISGFSGKSASISNELYPLNMGCCNKDLKVHQQNRGVEP